MAIDTDSATLQASITLTGNTVTSAYQGDNMSGFCVQAVVSNGLFTAATYGILQGSTDGTNYADVVDSTTTISGTGTTYLWNYDAPFFNYTRLRWVVPSGNVVSTVTIRTMGER